MFTAFWILFFTLRKGDKMTDNAYVDRLKEENSVLIDRVWFLETLLMNTSSQSQRDKLFDYVRKYNVKRLFFLWNIPIDGNEIKKRN